MKINEIRYDKTFNLGNYENEKIGVSCAVAEEESAYAVLAAMKIFVATRGLEVPETPKVEEKPKITSTTELKVYVEEAPIVEELKPKKAKAKATTKAKAKGTPYDRTNEIHKKLFSELLSREFPTWKTKQESKDAGRDASKALEGEEFLDSEGLILPSFTELVKIRMGKVPF